MLCPTDSVQVYLYAEPVDMRKSIDGLSVLVKQEMARSPSMEALFVFCNRGRDKIKLLCSACEDGVQTAPLPPQPIPKSNASPGLLAHVVTAKYQDALPLHRQETVLNRSGVEIPRNTLASWMIKSLLRLY